MPILQTLSPCFRCWRRSSPSNSIGPTVFCPSWYLFHLPSITNNPDSYKTGRPQRPSSSRVCRILFCAATRYLPVPSPLSPRPRPPTPQAVLQSCRSISCPTSPKTNSTRWLYSAGYLSRPLTLCFCLNVGPCFTQYHKALADDDALWKSLYGAKWAGRRKQRSSFPSDETSWKSFFAERQKVEKHWKSGAYSIKTIQGHSGACVVATNALSLIETLQVPSSVCRSITII